MPESTAKKQLLEQDFISGTPAKKLVARDINSWMETHEKSAKNKNISLCLNGQSKYKIHRRLPPKFTSQDTKLAQSGLKSKDTPNISALKRRKDDLMKTMSIKKWTCENTKPNTAEASTGQHKKPLEWLMKLPLIHVNQFMVQQKDKQQFQQATVIPAFSIRNSAVTSRKQSLKKIDRKQKDKNGSTRYYHFKQFNQPVIRNKSTENTDVIQEKICKNNYMGLLSAVRKSSRVIFQLKLDKYSVRI